VHQTICLLDAEPLSVIPPSRFSEVGDVFVFILHYVIVMQAN
jgi:hypothetical protein